LGGIYTDIPPLSLRPWAKAEYLTADSKRVSNLGSPSLLLTVWHVNILVTELKQTSLKYCWIRSQYLLTSESD